MNLLDFEFLTIANLFIVLLWPASGTYTGARSDVLRIILIIFTVLVVLLDIVFLVLKIAH